MQIDPSVATAQDNVRKYFRKVMERHELPALPFVASKVLDMIQDPDLNVRQLCRVLADDTALAARVLSVSRTAHYAQRTLPTTLLGAVQVLGKGEGRSKKQSEQQAARRALDELQKQEGES